MDHRPNPLFEVIVRTPGNPHGVVFVCDEHARDADEAIAVVHTRMRVRNLPFSMEGSIARPLSAESAWEGPVI